jgi:hypothetical protein
MTDLPLNQVLGALDNKDMGFWDRCTPEHQKKIAPFLLNRYMSLIKSNGDIAAYYLMSTNKRVNKQYFELAKHPKLVWQLLCTVSPGMGKQFHQWVGNKKKDASDKKTKDIYKVLEGLYPTAKRDELDLMANKMTKKDIKQLLISHGEQ